MVEGPLDGLDFSGLLKDSSNVQAVLFCQSTRHANAHGGWLEWHIFRLINPQNWPDVMLKWVSRFLNGKSSSFIDWYLFTPPSSHSIPSPPWLAPNSNRTHVSYNTGLYIKFAWKLHASQALSNLTGSPLFFNPRFKKLDILQILTALSFADRSVVIDTDWIVSLAWNFLSLLA